APACVQVTRKFYALPNLPPGLLRKKRRAMSNSYLKGMAYAYVGGPAWGIIASYAIQAMTVDPTNFPAALVQAMGCFTQGTAARGDVLTIPFPSDSFDVILNCSTVEHVGIAGRYGVTESAADGDLAAMTRLRRWLKPGGVMLLTVPVGHDAVFAPLTRVYGRR